MKISVINIGCKVNFAESSQLENDFADAGIFPAGPSETPDVIVVNTCTVTSRADADSRKAIRRAIRNFPDAFVAVVGCFAQLEPKQVLEIEGVDAVYGADEKFKLLETVKSFEKREKPLFKLAPETRRKFYLAGSIDSDSHSRIMLKIQDGCDYGCSYCAVPAARGPSRGASTNEILNYVDGIASSIFYEIVLTGINLGDWESGSRTFVDLLKLIRRKDCKGRRFRLSSIEPNLLSDEIIDIVASSSKFCPHFHVPLQSGSNDLLADMGRRYRVGDFERLLQKIKTKIPECGIGADVIVGFPGETDEKFRETYDVISASPVSYLHVFTYSDRPSAPASKFPGKVHPQIVKARVSALRKLSLEKTNEFYKSQIGKEASAIPEKYYPESRTWRGWTGNYIRVEFEGPKNLQPRPTDVRLDSFDKKFVKSTLLRLS